ncbi:hypothetical protein GX51_03990 [Blastomyces parvus]|uniref:Large ribosomal subunit protein mL67 n=1 Tax=Blastomyces parvus TaxID=2060905 RepID=A0A2B7WW10_9EURO|nr:hypothetical protein GX51_03990 [Blastomyces parvus]
MAARAAAREYFKRTAAIRAAGAARRASTSARVGASAEAGAGAGAKGVSSFKRTAAFRVAGAARRASTSAGVGASAEADAGAGTKKHVATKRVSPCKRSATRRAAIVARRASRSAEAGADAEASAGSGTKKRVATKRVSPFRGPATRRAAIAARRASRSAEAGAGAEASAGAGAKKRVAKELAAKRLVAKEPSTVSPAVVTTSGALRFPQTTNPIQGKPRDIGSRAALLWRRQERERLRKALHRLTHGKNIFAYNNIRTNQVVYSFTRELEKNNVLSQLVYHGKKTIPATLRKDMWTPYFSLHFASASQGLEAYRLLREFSMQRQLAPPADMITASEENEVLTRQRPRDPNEAKKWDEKWKDQMEKRYFLNKRLRARVLMDQKATSVADVAAVLALQEQKMKEEREQEAKENELENEDQDGGDEEGGEKAKGKQGIAIGERDKSGKKISRKRRMRMQAAIRAQQELEKKTVEKIRDLERMLRVKIDPLRPLSEHHIVKEGEVKMFWMDLHNLQYAESWPDNVIHGQLKGGREHIMGTQLDLAAGELLALGSAPASKAGENSAGAEQTGGPGSDILAEAKDEAQGAEGKDEAPKEEETKSVLGKLKFW